MSNPTPERAALSPPAETEETQFLLAEGEQVSASIVETLARLSPEAQERLLALALAKTSQPTVKETPPHELVELMQRLEANREQSKTDISRVAARFFIGLISAVVAFIVLAPMAVAMGIPLDWRPASDALLEIIKIAVLPIVMLVLGFHFGTGQTSLLKDLLSAVVSRVVSGKKGDA